MRLRWLMPGKERAMAAFVLVVRLGLGVMFIASSVPKILQPYMFLGNVYAYELVGPKIGLVVAMVLPWLELLVGACLVGGVFVGAGLLAGTGMGVLFTFVLASALYRHLDISCGCFSTAAVGKISYLTVTRAIVITLLSGGAYAVTILLAPKRWEAASSEPIPETARSDPKPSGLLLQRE
jgi:uncharacterized membrane protein YphA (DoxX/SURF4 family)